MPGAFVDDVLQLVAMLVERAFSLGLYLVLQWAAGFGQLIHHPRLVFLDIQPGVDIHLGAVDLVLAAFDDEVAAHRAMYLVGVDTRSGQMGIAGTVEGDVTRRDQAVVLGGTLQVIHIDLGPRIDAALGLGCLMFTGVGQGGFADAAPCAQGDAPVTMGLGRLRRLLQDAAVLRIQANAGCADLSALQVDGIGCISAAGEADLAAAVQLPDDGALVVFRHFANIEIGAEAAGLDAAFGAAGLAGTEGQAAAQVAAVADVAIGGSLQV